MSVGLQKKKGWKRSISWLAVNNILSEEWKSVRQLCVFHSVFAMSNLSKQRCTAFSVRIMGDPCCEPMTGYFGKKVYTVDAFASYHVLLSWSEFFFLLSSEGFCYPLDIREK